MDSPVFSLIVIIAVGIILILMGIANMRGNITTLHKYHTKNIREEDKVAFGRLSGIGHIIVGLSLIINAILSTIATRLDNLTYATIGNIILIAGAILGLVIIFYSIIKYNKKDKNTD